VTLSDLAKYSMTWSITQSFCDSWASCFSIVRFCVCIFLQFCWQTTDLFSLIPAKWFIRRIVFKVIQKSGIETNSYCQPQSTECSRNWNYFKTPIFPGVIYTNGNRFYKIWYSKVVLQKTPGGNREWIGAEVSSNQKKECVFCLLYSQHTYTHNLVIKT